MAASSRPAAQKRPGSERLRQSTMSVLLAASPAEFAMAEATIGPLPAFRHLRRPETGLLMLRGRIGGEGARFNLGEATVTRCFVITEAGTEGAAYHLGRDLAKTEKAALFEALAREPPWADKVEAVLLAPVRARVAEERRSKAAASAATRVEFFTMVRGEDQR
ncbi:MAG: phosphonate C-P lyase system protein PhnG [Hyphomicrobiales bacterium]|nr:phosphonate C-P lyase system protein PhnG [Hyphomicrobiales bacterium]